MSTSFPILLVGLGNLGEQYEHTRHNAGRQVIRYLILDIGMKEPRFEEKLKALVSEGRVGKHKVVAALPETFMNNSGKAVERLVKYYKVKPENVWVVHDDMDLPLGTIRIVKNRHSAGHRGVESVKRALKTWDFVRFRIGTAPPSWVGKKGVKFTKARKKQMIDLLLKPWKKLEEGAFKKAYKKAAEAIMVALKEGLEIAMNTYNQKSTRN